MPRRGTWQDGWWSPAQAWPSPNCGARPSGAKVSLVVLHAISLPPGQYRGGAVRALFGNRLDVDQHPYFQALRGLKVSAHFFIRRSGRVAQCVSCDDRAWHAGVSSWRGRDNCNDWSIGVELEGLEGDTFEPAQYRQLARLLSALARRYPLAEVVGHEHVAPGRKGDPGPGFDWKRTAAMLRGGGRRLWVHPAAST
jgi:N-acetyl-anhydromuramoyl-L-alanine amidase